jgi:hypothetical protein
MTLVVSQPEWVIMIRATVVRVTQIAIPQVAWCLLLALSVNRLRFSRAIDTALFALLSTALADGLLHVERVKLFMALKRTPCLAVLWNIATATTAAF